MESEWDPLLPLNLSLTNYKHAVLFPQHRDLHRLLGDADSSAGAGYLQASEEGNSGSTQW